MHKYTERLIQCMFVYEERKGVAVGVGGCSDWLRPSACYICSSTFNTISAKGFSREWNINLS